jgi:hypothetical protein
MPKNKHKKYTQKYKGVHKRTIKSYRKPNKNYTKSKRCFNQNTRRTKHRYVGGLTKATDVDIITSIKEIIVKYIHDNPKFKNASRNLITFIKDLDSSAHNTTKPLDPDVKYFQDIIIRKLAQDLTQSDLNVLQKLAIRIIAENSDMSFVDKGFKYLQDFISTCVLYFINDIELNDSTEFMFRTRITNKMPYVTVKRMKDGSEAVYDVNEMFALIKEELKDGNGYSNKVKDNLLKKLTIDSNFGVETIAGVPVIKPKSTNLARPVQGSRGSNTGPKSYTSWLNSFSSWPNSSNPGSSGSNPGSSGSVPVSIGSNPGSSGSNSDMSNRVFTLAKKPSLWKDIPATDFGELNNFDEVTFRTGPFTTNYGKIVDKQPLADAYDISVVGRDQKQTIITVPKHRIKTAKRLVHEIKTDIQPEYDNDDSSFVMEDSSSKMDDSESHSSQDSDIDSNELPLDTYNIGAQVQYHTGMNSTGTGTFKGYDKDTKKPYKLQVSRKSPNGILVSQNEIYSAEEPSYNLGKDRHNAYATHNSSGPNTNPVSILQKNGVDIHPKAGDKVRFKPHNMGSRTKTLKGTITNVNKSSNEYNRETSYDIRGDDDTPHENIIRSQLEGYINTADNENKSDRSSMFTRLVNKMPNPKSRSSAYKADNDTDNNSIVEGKPNNSQSKKHEYKVDDVVIFNENGKNKQGIIIEQIIYNKIDPKNQFINYSIVIYDAKTTTFSGPFVIPEAKLILSSSKIYESLKKHHVFKINDTVDFTVPPNKTDRFTGTITKVYESQIYRTYDIQGNIPGSDGISATRNGIYLSVPESDITKKK